MQQQHSKTWLTGNNDTQANRRHVAGNSILRDLLGEPEPAGNKISWSQVDSLYCRHHNLTLATLYFEAKPLHLPRAQIPSVALRLVRAMDGPLLLDWKGRHIEVARTDVVILGDNTMPAMTLPAGGRLDCAKLATCALGPLEAHFSRLSGCAVDANCPPMQLLSGYAGYLLQQRFRSVNEASLMVSHFFSLLPVLKNYLQNMHLAGDVLPERCDVIKAYIQQHLGDAELNISRVAAHVGITPRALQKRLQKEGLTFSRYLLDCRLAQVKEALTNDNGARQTVSQIAYAAGFNDLSYFNRCFRKHYGMRPTELRQR